ncbi:zinc-dependent alcohol dehydrogenase family protein [Pseudomonas protegens]|uniref:zinc-dependent alcohol dehydrogenase family protein n=2 Tax=Pseudomonas protegens TaxID=380021 RepID=UPI001B341D5E|nr:zinc-dependent alcohol dehydrogenase family protein [Pseudomonas protegens]MBP5099077.1 zinc-dependent alcohol dehydrogenase family protein [Pseudomonas protegens]MBP5102893.1 zinc-dependent alcohol dehydrogenase family protein [Pseudomonas protegens]MBP5117922.1 zinc-dependent alcohol dehydrogenase family protein [Pseudomonas protegens]MBP5125081.1 zinc-dependent alcohol dehydrogenase family protein [Pseudomonas protegens]MBP5130966.1 zinc-dependent alcohol dehydrogenase family protein [Ps
MKQIRFDRFGSPSRVAYCAEVDEPGMPAPWEVLVQIEACALNLADLARLSGRYGELPQLPATLGLEAVGQILHCGDAVTDLREGQRVILLGNDNWCQRRRVAASLVHPLPMELDPLQTASLKVSACTAIELLRRQKNLQPGAWIIQNAPLSSVGRAVMQVARHDGLRTLNIVRRATAVSEVLAHGGDVALLADDNLVQSAKSSMGYALGALALDAVGGEGVAQLGALLEPESSIIQYGMLSGKPSHVACEDVIFRGIQLKGFWLGQHLTRMPHQQRDTLMNEAAELLTKDVLQTEVTATYALDEITAALRHFETPGRIGRIYLLPNGPLRAATQMGAEQHG